MYHCNSKFRSVNELSFTVYIRYVNKRLWSNGLNDVIQFIYKWSFTYQLHPNDKDVERHYIDITGVGRPQTNVSSGRTAGQLEDLST